MENNEDIERESQEAKSKKNKTIKVVVLIVILIIILVGLACLGYKLFINKDMVEGNKNNELITKDTLFLCPEEYDENNYDGNGVIELVKATDKKYENEVCDGKFVGKYVCTSKNCGFKFQAQSFGNYSHYDKGVAVIYDNNEENYSSYGFLYDFKNNRKLSIDLGFSQIFYHDNNKDYFVVYSDKKGSAILDSQGDMTIDFNKYDNISACPGCSAPNGEESINNNGIIVVKKNNKYGFVDLTTGKETTKIEFDQYGLVGASNTKNSYIWVDEDMANRNSKEIYVVSENKAKIINFKTGKVVKNLDKVYTYAFPLSTDLVLVVDNQKIDILNKDNKSILEEKITFNKTVSLVWNVENGNWKDYDFKKFKIVVYEDDLETEHNYLIDIENKTVS